MKILVAYDGSSSADAALEDLRQAGLPERGEALVVCVADEHHTPEGVKVEGGDSWRSKLAEAESLAQSAADRIRANFSGWAVSSKGLWGAAAKILLEASGWWHPDLLIVGSHGRSQVARLFLGSVSLELVHKAPCSVRVVRPVLSRVQGPVRLVIGNDGSPQSNAVIRSVCGRRWPENTEAKIVSVAQSLVPAITALEANTFAQEPAYTVICQADERMRVRLGNIAAESTNALRRAGLDATHAVIDGDPREVLLRVAEVFNADAIFVGARGLGRLERLLLGSVSSYVVTHAHCTVEVVRG